MPAKLDQVRRRSRTLLRKAGVAPSGPLYGRLVDAGRSLPIPPKARSAVSTAVLRRPWHTMVPLDRLLMGAQGGWTAREFADRTDDMLWPSTPFLDGPHVALLRLVDERGADHPLTDEELLGTAYCRLGLRCIAAGSTYFGATDEAGVITAARVFIERYQGKATRQRGRRPDQSGPGDPVLVAPVRGSDYYQVLDGHHRLAVAAMRGRTTAPVLAKWLPVTTPLQDHLLKMSWIDGNRELYQPLDAPELHNWARVRQCTDRLEKMQAFLAERQIAAPASYLDVASCYGWFVSQMSEAGFTASGMERDPLAIPLGRAAYGLPGDAIATGDCVELLRDAGRTWDVVSCFSLLHHFVLGRGSVSAEELIKLLDRATGRVLFFDTGQGHEEWFRTSLHGWDPARIAAFLREHTTFDEIVDLGPDDDARPPYDDNYGRHLFACVRGR
ncbi:hypothetical protein ACGFNU_41320 [Spirillospora sp. NPDC048911]|uniref:hypothetical protein n=1 Tax=Spirillospora sp. NPDC048911 TaxID=3364527 RepID=UPI0037107A9A